MHACAVREPKTWSPRHSAREVVGSSRKALLGCGRGAGVARRCGSLGGGAGDREGASRYLQHRRAVAPIKGAVHAAPSTPGDLLFHIRSERPDLCFEFERILLDSLGTG